MIQTELKNIGTILCLGAHADDIEIGCGASILTLLERNPGSTVHWVVLGATGQREVEARQCADKFLANAARADIVIEHFPDAEFPFHGKALKTFFSALRRDISPDVIFSHRLEDRHQDHRTVAELTWQTFREQLILEYEIPKYDGDLGQPNVFMRIDEQTCERKVANIIESYSSQSEKHWFHADTFRSLMRIRGIESKSPSGLAEGLFCRKMVI